MTTSHLGYHDRTTERPVIARALAMILGVVFLVVGIVGFIRTGFDGFFDHHTDEHLLWFELNPMHNVVHLAFGVIGVLLARTTRGALTYGLIVGIGYGAALIYGLVALDQSWDFLSINVADNWLHAALAAVGLLIAALAAGELAEQRQATELDTARPDRGSIA